MKLGVGRWDGQTQGLTTYQATFFCSPLIVTHGMASGSLMCGAGKVHRHAPYRGVSWRTPASCRPDSDGTGAQGFMREGLGELDVGCQGNKLGSLCIP